MKNRNRKHRRTTAKPARWPLKHPNFLISSHTKLADSDLTGTLVPRSSTHSKIGSRSRRSPRQWDVDEDSRLESSQLLLRRIRQVRRLVRQDVAQQLVSALILSRLDYCNSLLSRLPWSASTACDECSCPSRHESVDTRPCRIPKVATWNLGLASKNSRLVTDRHQRLA